MASSRASVRLDWLDGMKGIAILWIAFFHSFSMLDRPWPLSDGYWAEYRKMCAPESSIGEIGCALGAIGVAITKLGFHAVAVFIVLSGFGLTYSLAKTGDPPNGWLGWYKSRVLRLFPMYWLAHVVYLVSPFQSRPERIDYRFLLSFLGDRVWPLDMIFYYFNPALWYFGLLLQLYLVFPLLFRLLQRAGVGGFLVVAAVATFGCRYVLLCVWPVNGNYVQGAFFLPRLWEFAFGMALGWLYRKDTARADSRLFSLATLAAAGVVYLAGLECYGDLRAYTFADALTGTGLTIILAHVAKGAERIGPLGRALATVGAYSYGLYLLHQPYVLYFSALAKPLPTAGFLAAMWTLIAVLAIVSMAIERRVNALTQRIVG